MAIRAEMGWFSLPAVAQRRQRGAAVEVRRGSHPVFSGTGRSGAAAESNAVYAGRRNRRAAWQELFVRRPAAADSSGSEPCHQVVAADSGAVSRLRSFGHGNRQEARRATPQQTTAG